MSCENLVPRSVFDAEINKLKKEIAALKTAGLNQTQIQQAKSLSSSVAQTVVSGVVQLAVVSQVPKIVQTAIAQSEGKVVSLAAKRAEMIAAQKVAPLAASIGKVEKSVSGLGATVAKYGDDIVKQSKLLSGVQKGLAGLTSKLAPFLAKLAPFLKILDVLLTGFTVYQLIQLTRRMTNAERGLLALQTALTFAGGKLLTAAYVANLEAKLAGQTAVNAQQFNALTTQINNQHNITRQSINGNVTAQHTATQQAINTNTNIRHNETRNIVNNNVNVRHNETRNIVNNNTNIRHNETRNIVNTNVNAQHVVTRQSIGQNSQAVREIQAHRAEFRQFNDSLHDRFQRQIVAPISRQVSGFQAQFTAFNDGLNRRFNQHIVSPIIDWQNRYITPRVAAIQQTTANTFDRVNQTYDKMIERFGKLWDYLKMDRVLNVLTTAASIHNAAMLSRNLAASLIDTIGETAAIIGFKDADGQAYDLNAILGRSAQSLVTSVIGEDAFNNLSVKWRNANRIISAGAGVVMAVRSAQWALTEGVETIGTWVARIGNGIEDDGLVADRKWPWMRENLQINQFSGLSKITNSLESAEEVTENIYMTVAAGQEISEAVDQMRQSSANFRATLEQASTAEEQARTQRETESSSPEPTVDDLAQFEPDPEVP